MDTQYHVYTSRTSREHTYTHTHETYTRDTSRVSLFIMQIMYRTHRHAHSSNWHYVTTRSATPAIIHLATVLCGLVNLAVYMITEVRAQYLFTGLMCWKGLKQENRTEELSYFGQDGSLPCRPPKLRSIIGALKGANRRQSAHLDSSEWVDY